MAKRRRRVFSREVKLSAVQRLLAGERVTVLSRELKLGTRHFYLWRDQYLAGGAAALRAPGRPGQVAESGSALRDGSGNAIPARDLATAQAQITELERKIGRQQVELDFFRQALRQVRELSPKSDGRGATRSTRSSKR